MSSAEPVWTDRRVVADLMLRNPKTLPGDASVADVRAVLTNPRVQLVLLADGQRFRGAVSELPDDADPAAPALDFAERSPITIGPTESAEAAFAAAAASPHRRAIVLDDRGNLLGLLCLNETLTRFCGATVKRAEAGSQG
jgi:CBS domain-containing protein